MDKNILELYMGNTDWTWRVVEYDDLARLREKSEQYYNFLRFHSDLSLHVAILLHSVCHTIMTSFRFLTLFANLFYYC